MKKVGMLLVTIFFAVIATFCILSLMPGNPLEIMARDISTNLGIPYKEAYERASMILNYDPNLPVYQQIINFGKNLLTGNLGQSIKFKTDVIDIVKIALPWTLLITGISTILSFAVGTVLGMVLSWLKSKKINFVVDTVVAILGAVPEYIIGYFLVLLLAVRNPIFPARGAYSSAVEPGVNLPFFESVFNHAFLPILAFFIVNLVSWVVNMRAVSSGVMGEDFIQYAKARGLSNKQIILRYIGKNSMIPMVTSLASTFGLLVGGAPLIENLFAYPGIGYYLNNGVGSRDLPLMQGMFFIIIITVIMCNFFVDLLYGVIDPRLRRKKA